MEIERGLRCFVTGKEILKWRKIINHAQGRVDTSTPSKLESENWAFTSQIWQQYSNFTLIWISL